ncbi:glycosyltransferase family 4 protein [Algisphaera agarilytica]|uniref:Glycosyltransferase involved in cell wall biosynthesis n=1 Tax=Algisphaera agarilytica TaxID=1385975 RepID=A0A7X0H711_9BACT|nr:glycosyltransferase family 4 protein [Algisphaera agarilytica]MBB6430452.1 glycosyltransferase involved in cell wall biosynthesis [Algisphaera agarilytica]
MSDTQDTPSIEKGSAGHVLVVAPTPFFSDRGCHVRIIEEIRAAEREGYRATVITYHVGKDVEGLPIYRSLNVPWYKKLAAGPSIHQFYLDALLLCTGIRACFRDKPTVIHGHLHEGVGIGKVLSLLFRVPLVGDLQGSLVGELVQHNFIPKQGFVHNLFRAAERWLIRWPNHLVLSSDRATEGVAEIDELTVPATVLDDGVDENAFLPEAPGENLREKLGLPTDKKLVGFLGVLNEYQGVSVMLHAAKRVVEKHPDVVFVVMGYPNVEHYQGVADELGISDSVMFPGRIPYDQARDYLAACDIGFSAKADVTEANGKLLNYMAVGLPIVATETRVNRSLLDDTALYGQVDDGESLADAVCRYLDDPALAEEKAQAGRRRVIDKLSWAAGGRKLVEVYASVTKKKNKPTKPQGTPTERAGASALHSEKVA